MTAFSPDYFNPDVMLIGSAHQDFLSEVKEFNAGKGCENFNEFIIDDAIEIKMFAVDVKYQDVFFEYDGEDLPISA